MERHTTLEHWPTVLAFLFVLYLIATPLAACAPQPWKQDPDVQAARRDCAGLVEEKRYACIERHAVDRLNPDVCRLAGMWVDDMCLQAVYQAAGDPTICDRLYLKGVRPTCHTYYASLGATATSLSTPLALTETYTDTMLGLALDYPAGWQVDAVADAFVHLYAPAPYTSTVGVVRYPQPSGATMDAVLDGVLQGGEGPRITYTQTLTVGGQPAVQVFFGPPENWQPGTVILVADPAGDWWTIDGHGELAIFNQVVGTLRWLPRDLPAPTAAFSPTSATTLRPTPVPTSNLGKLAYVQGGDIWVKALPDGEPQRLTDDGRNSTPRWSPSGEWLTFHKGDDVWLMHADGTNARHVPMASPQDHAWSPMADRLAYISTQASLHVIESDALADTGPRGEGQALHRAASEGQVSTTFHSLSWSPDGRGLAYVSHSAQSGTPPKHVHVGIKYFDLESGPRELYALPSPPQDDLILAGWTPDGQHILFWRDLYFSASAMADGSPLLRLSSDGGDPVEVADSTLLHPDFWSGSPTGRHGALTVGGGRETWTNKYIALLDLDTGSRERLTDETVSAFSPAFSPDGQQIAYVAAPDIGFVGGGDAAKEGAARRRIWVMNVDGSNQRPLTDDPAYRDERPLWSADGTHLLFARMDEGGHASLWLMDAAGSAPEQVVDELGPLPGPSPDWFGYYGHVEWDSLFDWWQGSAVREVSLSPRDQLSAEILDALAAYQPVMDAQPTVTMLLSNIARWLNTGGTPSDLAAVLNEASDRTESAITVTELDLAGDGRDEVVVHIPVMGLPLLVFVNDGGSPAHFEGHALPLDFETIQHGRPVDLSLETHGIEQLSLQLTDLTGDGVPEVLLNYVFAGGSNFRLRPQVFQWHEGDFRLIFAAELVSWAGYSTLDLEPNPVGGQDIMLHYPYFYNTGFEAKMIAHPQATQRWRWDPSLERYALQETSCAPESVLADGEDVPEWELLRVLVNEAELPYQAGDLEGALAGYQDVMTRAADMERPQERAPHWPAYARFRIAQVQAMLGQADAARTELNGLLADLDEESNLRPLVRAFDQSYDPAQPDAALRAMAALHGLHLYEQFYRHDDRPGDLTFPMSMGPLLWPGTPLARYLDAHPEAVDGLPSEREQTLLHTLSDLGFPVTDVRIVDLNADGLAEDLVTTDETDQHNGPRCTWLLAQTGDRWRSHRPSSRWHFCTEEMIEKPLPDGRIVMQWRDSAGEKFAFAWTGEALIEVDPETYEPLPPWPVVGW